MIEILITNWKYVVIAGVTVALGGMTNAYLGKRDELASQSASIESIGRMATTALAEKTKEGEDNLTQLRKYHESKIPEIRNAAVANYLAHIRVRGNVANSGPVRTDGTSIRVDDVSVKQCVPDDAFIRECAVDASKVAAWQTYCISNHCPVAP